MLSNPELTRNLWIECAPLKLAAATAAPALVLILSATDRGWPKDLFVSAHYLLLLAVAFWGARKAADAVARELRERTWDQQRLSGLNPTAMTIGKAFGAPSAVWALIGVCLIAQAIALIGGAETLGRRDPLLFGFPIGLSAMAAQAMGAFFVFAAAFFAGLLALTGQERPRAFDATLFQLAGVAAGVALVGAVSTGRLVNVALQGDVGAPVAWWDLEIEAGWALTASFLAFGAWALYGGVHQMRRAFAVDTNALAWVAFLAFSAAFVAGWWPERWALLSALSVGAAAYAAALFEPHRLAAYRDWTRRLGAGDARALITAPAWIYAWAGASALAVTALALNEFELPFDAPRSIVEQVTHITPAGATAAAILFALRDMAICVWAGLRAADGRGLWAAALILASLHVLLGPLAGLTIGSDGVALFAPINITSAVSAAAQASIALVLVASEIARPVAAPSATPPKTPKATTTSA